jgi:ribosomal protein L40E
MANTTTELAKNKCLHILQQTVQIFEQFYVRLQDICAWRKKSPIEHIVHLFPDIQQAENDLELLKPLLDPAALPQLLSIVSFWKNRSRIHHICTGLMQLTTRVSAASDPTLFIQVCGINETTSGEECTFVHEQYRDKIEKRFPDTILTFIACYSSSSDLFDFLHSLTADDIYNLQEAVNDWDETLINTKTVFDFAIVKNFIDRAYEAMEVKRQELKNAPFQLEHIIACFTDVSKNDQFTDLLKCLESSSLAVSSIKRIHLELTDKEQSKRRQIADILQKSIVYFVRVGHHEVKFDVNVELSSQRTTINNEKKQQKITFADLSELRDRARLLEYSSNVNKKNVDQADSERDKERLRNFIRFASITESTIENLMTLYTAGHPSISEFLVGQKTFSCNDGMFDDLQQNNKILADLLNDWEIKLCAIYERHIGLTYLSGDQFWQIEDYIYRRSSFSDPGYHLLKFIGINPNSIEQPTKRPQKPDERLENLGRLLSGQQQASNREEENPKTKKCLLVETTNEGILRAILSLFSLTKTPPSVCRLFYCTQRTNWIQVRAFVYRCFYSQTCQQIIRPELLSQSIQDQFIRLLRSLVDQRPHHIFRMGIVTTTIATNQQMINSLQSMQILNVLRDHELLNKDVFHATIQRMIFDCRLITSKITGLGKSSVIRHAIESSKKNYVKFPISGDYDVDTLAERLRSKYDQLQSAAIHLDIGAIDNNQQLNEILYCLLLFRSFRFGQVAVSIPEDTIIYMELDASPQSTLTEVPLLQHIQPSKPIDRVDWTTLNVESVEIQTVANYLQAIVSEAITKQNVNQSTFKKLDGATCSRLIQDQFLQNKNEDFITWTQLSIFIAVFYRLFTGFSLCGYFLVEYVSQPALRMDLVETLLRSSNQFTSLSVEAVRKQQRSVGTNEPEAFSEAIVRWDKIQPFTLVFTATNEPLFVYKRSADVPRALVEYFKMYYQTTRGTRETTEGTMFPEYTNLTHTEFFIKLASLSRKYFNKSICPKCYHQYEFAERQCSRCPTKDPLIRPKSFDHSDVMSFQTVVSEILQNEYVLTPDNFVKMLLIYMRVQSGIPVLIMGETGKRIVHIRTHFFNEFLL